MRHYRYIATLILLTTWALQYVNAQVPVVDAGQGDTSTTQQSSQSAQDNANSVVINLYMQLEQLQREVQNLRGLMEEQSYRIQRMETEQRDRYLDLDRRLSALTTGNGIEGGVNNGLAGTNSGPSGRNPSVNNPGIPLAPQVVNESPQTDNANDPLAGPLSEQDLYRSALGMLLEEEEYQRSITMFQQYIDTYPNGRNIANAYYWKGAALVLVSRFNEAVTDFQAVIENYPEHQKAAGSLLKLGEAYNRMGDRALARETWESISATYPDSLAEITVAQGYLQQFPAN